MPWYSAQESACVVLAGRWFGMLVSYLRDGDRVFETYWTTGRRTEVMAPAYGLLERTIYGRREPNEVTLPSGRSRRRWTWSANAGTPALLSRPTSSRGESRGRVV